MSIVVTMEENFAVVTYKKAPVTVKPVENDHPRKNRKWYL